MWFYIFSVCFLVYVGTSAMEDEISTTKAKISALKAEISALKAKINATDSSIDSQLDKQQLLALTNYFGALTHLLVELYRKQETKELEGNVHVYRCSSKAIAISIIQLPLPQYLSYIFSQLCVCCVCVVRACVRACEV